MLYGTRLLVQNELVRDAFDAPGHGYIPWALCITYVINIPFALFARELLGHGWKASISIWVWASLAFAVIAVPTAFFLDNAYWISLMNGALVVSGTAVIFVHVLVERKRGNWLAAALLWPLLIFGIFIVLENIGITFRGRSVEPIGFFILLAGLAFIAVRRALATERTLLDVQQELSTARRIQSSIIPQSLPAIEGIRLATRYEPMTAVAGDFYDFLTPSDDLLTILVADVSGHGVPAALVACMLKVCFAAQRNHAADPAAILSGLSLMLRGSLGGQYLTAACAAIDRKSNTVTYAGAGHPPTLLVREKTGELVLLAENGLFIGPFPNATYANMCVPFNIGDKLLLYTDGVTEANDLNGEEFGRDKLGQFLLRSNGIEPAEILDDLFEQITTGSQQDDLTAVLVHLG
jgi:phosphoserine phosphatase RsbU/P